MNKYQDIINLERPKSLQRPKATMTMRAAQFAPFSALTGYNEALEEIRRITTKRKNLMDNNKNVVNEKLRIIKENINKLPEVKISYFVADTRKEGGEYRKIKGCVRKIDEVNKVIIMKTRLQIPIEDIETISGDIFNSFEL